MKNKLNILVLFFNTFAVMYLLIHQEKYKYTCTSKCLLLDQYKAVMQITEPHHGSYKFCIQEWFWQTRVTEVQCKLKKNIL